MDPRQFRQWSPPTTVGNKVSPAVFKSESADKGIAERLHTKVVERGGYKMGPKVPTAESGLERRRPVVQYTKTREPSKESKSDRQKLEDFFQMTKAREGEYVWDRVRGQRVHKDVLAAREAKRRGKSYEVKSPKARTGGMRVRRVIGGSESSISEKKTPPKKAEKPKAEDKTWEEVQRRDGPRAIAAEARSKTSRRKKSAPKIKNIEEATVASEPKKEKKVAAPKINKIKEPKEDKPKKEKVAAPKEAKPAPIKPVEKPAAEKKAAPKKPRAKSTPKPKEPKLETSVAPKEPKVSTPKKPVEQPVAKPKETSPVKLLPPASTTTKTKKPGGEVTMTKPKAPPKSVPLKRLPGQGAGVMTGTTGGPQLTGQILPSTGTSTAKKALDDLEAIVRKAYGYSSASTSAPKAPKPVGAATPAAISSAGGKTATDGIKPSGTTGGPQLTGQTLPGTGGPKPAAPQAAATPSTPATTSGTSKTGTGESFFGEKPAGGGKPTADKPKKEPGEFIPSGYATGAAVGRFVGAETGGSTTGGTALPQAATGIAGQAMIGRGATVRGTSMEQAKTPTRAATVSARQSPARIGESPGLPTRAQATQSAMKAFQNVPKGISGTRLFIGEMSVVR